MWHRYCVVCDCQCVHYEVFCEDVIPEIFMPTAPQFGVNINVPATDKSLPLDNEIFPFRKGVLKVNGRSGIGRVDEYLSLFRWDWDEHAVSACEKMSDKKVSVPDETWAELHFEGKIFQLLWKTKSALSIAVGVQ